MDKEATDLIHALGFKIDVSQKIRELPVASQQIVEIARAGGNGITTAG